MRRLVALFIAVSVVACVPRLSPLTGVEAPASKLPSTQIPPGHRKVVFTWEMSDREMSARGDGAARIASPDSARLDFFLAGGFGQGGAILLGDSLRLPSGLAADLARRLIPPPTLLWAVLGRVALPNLPDTVIRVEGTTLRANIGNPVQWRLTFRGDTLTRAERVSGGRVQEWVDRSEPGHLHYRNEADRRSLQLVITRTEEVSEFDASIWRFDR